MHSIGECYLIHYVICLATFSITFPSGSHLPISTRLPFIVI